VDAVAALKKDEVSLGELAAKLGLDKVSPVVGSGRLLRLAISSTGRPEEVGRRGSSLAIRCRKW